MLRGPDHIAMRGGGRSISAMPLGGDDARGRACPTYEVTWTSTTPSSSLASFPCMHAPQAASLWGVSNWDNPREDVPAGERLVLLNDDLIKATGHRRRHVGIDFLDLNLTEKVVRFDCYTISSSGRLPPFSGFSTGPGQVPERSSVWQIDAPPIIKSKESESKGPQQRSEEATLRLAAFQTDPLSPSTRLFRRKKTTYYEKRIMLQPQRCPPGHLSLRTPF